VKSWCDKKSAAEDEEEAERGREEKIRCCEKLGLSGPFFA
jgi:hypothetical protein